MSLWVCWKKPPAAFSPLSRAPVLSVRSARKNGCGLAGRTLREDSGMLFLIDAEPLMSNQILGKFALENFCHSTLPLSKPGAFIFRDRTKA